MYSSARHRLSEHTISNPVVLVSALISPPSLFPSLPPSGRGMTGKATEVGHQSVCQSSEVDQS